MIASVLVGGKSERFGEDKLFYKIGEKSVIEETLTRLSRAKRIERVYLVASKGKGKKFEGLGFPVLEDPYCVGPIGGLLYSLETLGSCFIAAGDMPLICPEFVDFIVEEFENGDWDACIPCWESGYLEPLHAAYSSTLKERIREKISKGELSIVRAVEGARVKKIELWKLPSSFRISLFNLNERKDLERLLWNFNDEKRSLF